MGGQWRDNGQWGGFWRANEGMTANGGATERAGIANGGRANGGAANGGATDGGMTNGGMAGRDVVNAGKTIMEGWPME